MSIFSGMQPHSYCPQCGEPAYKLFNRICHTCPCRAQELAQRSYYSTDTTEPLPAIKKPALVLRICDFEEITPERAMRVYKGIVRATYHHLATCTDCDMLAEQGLMCPDQRAMWSARHWWLDKAQESEKLNER